MMKGLGMPRPQSSSLAVWTVATHLDGDISLCVVRYSFFHALFSNGCNKSNSVHVPGQSLSLCQQL